MRFICKRRINLHPDDGMSTENRTCFLPNARQMCYAHATALLMTKCDIYMRALCIEYETQTLVHTDNKVTYYTLCVAVNV